MTRRGTFSHKELPFGNDSFAGKNAFEHGALIRTGGTCKRILL